MKKALFTFVPLALMLTLALVACGKPAADGGPGAGGGSSSSGGGGCSTSQTIDLGQVNFVNTCATVSANQPVTFNDPTATGGIHIICTGSNAQCVADPNAPKELAAPGFQIQPGQTKVVTFTTPGTYHIACTVHPAMNLTLTVK